MKIDNDWCNNRISRKLNKEYQRDFSICDIDGMIRKQLGWEKEKTILIAYECKNSIEKVSEPQFKTLKFLYDVTKWDILHENSGVYIISILDDNCDKLKIGKFPELEFKNNDAVFLNPKFINFEEFVELFGSKKILFSHGRD